MPFGDTSQESGPAGTRPSWQSLGSEGPGNLPGDSPRPCGPCRLLRGCAGAVPDPSDALPSRSQTCPHPRAEGRDGSVQTGSDGVGLLLCQQNEIPVPQRRAARVGSCGAGCPASSRLQSPRRAAALQQDGEKVNDAKTRTGRG